MPYISITFFKMFNEISEFIIISKYLYFVSINALVEFINYEMWHTVKFMRQTWSKINLFLNFILRIGKMRDDLSVSNFTLKFLIKYFIHYYIMNKIYFI